VAEPLTLRVAAGGWRGVLLLAAALFALLVLPRLVIHPPSDTEAKALIRELRSRQVRDRFLPLYQGAPPDSARAVAESMGKALAELASDSIASLEMRMSWLAPPFTRRASWVVRARWRQRPAQDYYRISRGLASSAPSWWWRFPLF
jgi:hypothetical protein